MMKLTSNPGNVSKVEQFVNKLVNKYQISPDKQCNILISLTEAVTNAIIHGNRKDEHKVVKVRHQRKNDCLAVRVMDEGNGFDYQKLPDPTSPEHIMNEGGRGVFLMHQLADDIRYYDNGSTVEMEFKLR
ncbi:MAG: ATP-binding protein [Bacteroidetes bacterium]|nr:MAG: ATP-binding protein [Bacteroidota bacterium]